MALPAGVSTCTVTVGSSVSVFGDIANVKVTVTPVYGGNAKRIVWEATGQSIPDFSKTFSSSSDTQPVEFEVPHVNQPGFLDPAGNAITMWAYRVKVTIKDAANQTVNYEQMVQPLVGTSTIDLDLEPDDEVAGPVVVPPNYVTEPELAEALAGFGGGTVPDSALIENLPTPWFMAHRANMAVAPESAIESWDMALVGGPSVIIEGDGWLLPDGTLVNMHDSTVDRTTTGTGPISNFSALTWSKLEIDTAGLLGGTGYPVMRPPTWAQILHRYGNKIPMVFNAYGLKEVDAFDQLREQMGVDKRTIMMLVGNEAWGDRCVELGYWTRITHDHMADYNLANAAARGFNAVSVIAEEPTQQWIDQAHALGLKVAAFVGVRRDKALRLAAMGVDGFSVDDATYIANLPAIESRTDLFHIKAITPGFHAIEGPTTPTFSGTDEFGFDLAGAVQKSWRVGYMRPSNPDNFTLNFECMISDDGGNNTLTANVVLMDEDYTTTGTPTGELSAGYLFQIQAQNNLRIRRRNRDQTFTFLDATIPTTGFALGVWKPYRITVTPTTVRFERSDTGEGQTVTDMLARPVTRLFLQSIGVACRFRNLTFS